MTLTFSGDGVWGAGAVGADSGAWNLQASCQLIISTVVSEAVELQSAGCLVTTGGAQRLAGRAPPAEGEVVLNCGIREEAETGRESGLVLPTLSTVEALCQLQVGVRLQADDEAGVGTDWLEEGVAGMPHPHHKHILPTLT